MHSLSDLEQFFYNEPHRMIHKWKHYFEIYERHLHAYRGRKINILEIGISHGGSLQMWDYYFGGNANIYAIDINPECKKFEQGNVKVFIGSQQDPDFLNQLKAQIPILDILIDDGGHTMKQQLVSFEYLYDHVAEGGIYICEDLHTSYWKDFGGGYKRKSSFIEHSKNFIDKLHAWHTNKIPVDKFVQSTFGLHFYDSMLVIEKRKMEPPYDVKSGDNSIADAFADKFVAKK